MAPNSSEQCKKLYRKTLALFADIVALNRKLHLHTEHDFSLRESLSKLMLWGDDFQDDSLDELFSESTGLRNIAIAFLCEINMILWRDLGPVVLNAAATSKSTTAISTLVQKVTADIISTRTEIENYSYMGEEAGTPKSWGNMSDEHILHKAVSQIGFYVIRLMDMLPSMVALRDLLIRTELTVSQTDNAEDMPNVTLMTEDRGRQPTVAATASSDLLKQTINHTRLRPAPLILEQHSLPSNDHQTAPDQPLTPPATQHSTPTPTRTPLSPPAIKFNSPSTPRRSPFSPRRSKKRRCGWPPMKTEFKSSIN